jgi:hypothetical protein
MSKPQRKSYRAVEAELLETREQLAVAKVRLEENRKSDICAAQARVAASDDAVLQHFVERVKSCPLPRSAIATACAYNPSTKMIDSFIIQIGGLKIVADVIRKRWQP